MRAQAFKGQRPIHASDEEIAVWDKMKVTLIPQLYEHLFFIGIEPDEGGRPMFDLLYLTSLRKEGKSRALPHAELQSVAASESVAQTPSAQTPVAQTPVAQTRISNKEGKSRALPQAVVTASTSADGGRSLRGCVTNKDDSKSERQSTRDPEIAPEEGVELTLEAVSVEALSESDVASSLGELTQKAGLLEWNNHMTWCNRTLKKEVVELEKIQEHADNGKLVPPLLC